MEWRRKKAETAARVHREADRLICSGPWTTLELAGAERALHTLTVPRAGAVRVELSAVTGLDSAGALLLYELCRRLERDGRQVSFSGMNPAAEALFELVARHAPPSRPPARRARPWGALEMLGRQGVGLLVQGVGFIAFIGQTTATATAVLAGPRRARWTPFWTALAASGYRALPIVGLLAFLLGVVIAYQGGIQLQLYGANMYIADLVGLAMLRELAPLIAAVIVAGRTGSAYTAEIGTMKVNDEIDALRTMGIEPIEQLVLPKLLALVITLPLLTVWAGVMGLFGGIAISNAVLGISPMVFMERVGESVSLSSYLIGIGKAPVFAAIIAGVGCFQGFRVADSAESVGRQTTVSVVQSIFLVIVVDALFSIVFSEMGL